MERDAYKVEPTASIFNVPRVYLTRDRALRAADNHFGPEGVGRLPDQGGINRGNLPLGVVPIADSDGLMLFQTSRTMNNYICLSSLIGQI